MMIAEIVEPMLPTPGQKEYQRRTTSLRQGVLYHGTTQVQAEDILQNGFRVIPYDDLVQEVMAKLGLSPDKISRRKLKSLESERFHYEQAGTTNNQPMISSAPSPEIASRWAGSGGEVAKNIETILTGRTSKWRDPKSPLTGAPVVLQLRLNRQGIQSTNFLSYLQFLDRLDAHVQNGTIKVEDALNHIKNGYTDIKLFPAEIGRVSVLKRKFDDQGREYAAWGK